MEERKKQNDYFYAQGVASLELEGMFLTAQQHDIVRKYLAGDLNREELIKEALDYAKAF